jgi:hypothetical protein
MINICEIKIILVVNCRDLFLLSSLYQLVFVTDDPRAWFRCRLVRHHFLIVANVHLQDEILVSIAQQRQVLHFGNEVGNLVEGLCNRLTVPGRIEEIPMSSRKIFKKFYSN